MAPAENMKCVRCMTGPTASGKSGVAVRLAKSVGGEIINADALQVYKDLHILSARPTQAEMDGVPHHLFGHIDGAQRYSVGQWLREAVPVIQDVLARGHVPIIVGGTGLYFKALTEGLAHVPEPNSTAKTQSKTLLEQKGIAALRREAERVDPVAAARVLGNDPHRLLRIVAVAHGTQKRLSAWQAMTQPVIPRGYWHGMIIAPPRDELYAKIETRFDAMISAGGLEELRVLAMRGLTSDLPVMRAIGVRQLLPLLQGLQSEAEAIALCKRDTRRFAKRQFTWLRGQIGEDHPDWIWTDNSRTITTLKGMNC